MAVQHGKILGCALVAWPLLSTKIGAQQQHRSQPPIDVTVHRQTAAERLLQTAESVKVVETERAQHQAADLGEVLARTEGIGVQKSGGLGSTTRFSLNGLLDDQVRFFLDGLPLELSGFPFGIANVPVNLIERVEIYSGVVPIRLGADALGGAVNLVSRPAVRGTHAHASYEVGSFASHRIALGAQHPHAPLGLVVRADAFVDKTLNRYLIDVEATDERGRLYPVQVPRFHSRYDAAGLNVEVGVLGRPWARRLALRGFGSTFRREFQHNFSMTIPYGGASFSRRSYGANLRYEQDFGDTLFVDLVLGYANLRSNFRDVDACAYSWFGECLVMAPRGGETDSVPHDSLIWDNSGFARLNLKWLLNYDHEVRFAVAATVLDRTGEEGQPISLEARDPLAAQRDLLTTVSGLEYESDWQNDSVENVVFAKYYVQALASEEPTLRLGRSEVPYRHRDRTTHRAGVGNGLRYRVTDWLNAKLAYEWATRLPRAEEVFGDAALIGDNLELRPESSHNFNLGAQLSKPNTGAGDWRSSVNLFLREMDQLIFLTGDDSRGQSYQNVYSARSRGIEASAGWTSLREYLSINTNFTYQSLRNTSSDGGFGDFNGDRIPNRPYFFANASARFELRQLAASQDELSLTWHSRYVKAFFRSWESVGLRESKQVIPSQLVHSLSLVYLLKSRTLRSSSSLEVQNVGNARVYDFFGAQRPGRAVFMKTTVEY